MPSPERGRGMRRREFLGALGGAAVAWPLGARAQQSVTIGFLGLESPDAYESRLRVFRQTLMEAGYVEHRNLTIEYRWAERQPDRLPALAADLVNRRVAAIMAVADPAAQAAQASAGLPVQDMMGLT